MRSKYIYSPLKSTKKATPKPDKATVIGRVTMKMMRQMQHIWSQYMLDAITQGPIIAAIAAPIAMQTGINASPKTATIGIPISIRIPRQIFFQCSRSTTYCLHYDSITEACSERKDRLA